MDYLQNFLSKDKGDDLSEDKMMAELKAMGYEENEGDLEMDAEEAELKRFEDELLREEEQLMKASGADQPLIENIDSQH